MSAYITHLLIIIAIYALLAVSYNLMLGYTGLLNLAPIALFGIGAYTSALLIMKLGAPYLVALLAAGVLSAILAALLMGATKHIKGDYLALATFAFSYVAASIMLNWTSLTRGPLGIPGIPKPELLGLSIHTQNSYLALTIILVTISIFILTKIANSPFGRALQAVRDDEIGAAALGKNVVGLQLKATTISAFFIGIAGSLYAHYITYIDPSSFSLLELILLLTIVIVGGLASMKGSIIGAAIILLIPEALRFLAIPSAVLGPTRQIIYALILIAILLYAPKGLYGKVKLQ